MTDDTPRDGDAERLQILRAVHRRCDEPFCAICIVLRALDSRHAALRDARTELAAAKSLNEALHAKLIEARAEGARLDAAPAGDGWRPIETAPKDGTKIDVWQRYRIVDVYWSNIQDWWCTDGQYGPEEPDPLAIYPEPTHWRPRPPAPREGDPAMICDLCGGTGLLLVIAIEETGPLPMGYEPCQECGGTGIYYCCSGDCAQPDPEPRPHGQDGDDG